MFKNQISTGFGNVKYGEQPITRIKVDRGGQELHYIDVDCSSCTTASYIKETDEIEISIDTTKVGAKEGHLKLVTKFVYVHLDPSKPHFLADPATLMMYKNPDKPVVTISLGMVVQ